MNSWMQILEKVAANIETCNICCGLPLLVSGDFDGAREWFNENLKPIVKDKVIVTGCPSCYRMLKKCVVEVLGIEPDFDVKHIMEIVLEAMSQKKIMFIKEPQLKVTYHDPCELSRHMSITELPREILRKVPGVELIEMRLNREKATCCGGGGLMRLFFPQVSQEIATEKIKNEVVPLNVEAIVTACPLCEYILGEAIKDLGLKDKLKVLDLAELVLLASGEFGEY